jgi:hypothetical protein
MNWFFDYPEHRAALQAELPTWRGTPFHEGGRVKGKGGGTDCVGFGELNLFAVKLIPEFSFPRTETDFKGHVHNTKILDYLRGKMPGPESALLMSIFSELVVDEILPPMKWPAPVVSHALTGDLLIMKGNAVGVWHLPIMFDDRIFYHCAWPNGVTEGDATQPMYRDRIRAIFRARNVMKSGMGLI